MHVLFEIRVGFLLEHRLSSYFVRYQLSKTFPGTLNKIHNEHNGGLQEFKHM